ncbi:DUF2795 domain-containing protein [Paraburkholderia acidisoli]|uniref:DUF2795 domain-containing protein n=1 Tax=Paraburkholderia acidisoli TaxID=2571748 RepID=A0A7Z2JG79_9BURK|nr:DUF2795 domain-containing protein [Paraburkholderia acidisoli]QGZ63531.1 DUF2795 domain-containing protein [Paraburkholderia acidisoli]
MNPAPSHASAVASRDIANALADRVQSALDGVTWPAHPATLLECAAGYGAGRDVMDALRGLPDEAYGSFPEVSASIVATQMRAHQSESAPDGTTH